MQARTSSKTHKILIVTWGKRGDIQPLIGLAEALRNAGYYVGIQTNAYAKDIIEFYGFPFWSLTGDPEKLYSSPAFRESVENNDPEHYRESNEWQLAKIMIPQDIMLVVSESFDMIIAHSIIWEQAYLVHKRTKIPLIGFTLSPSFPTTKFKSSVAFSQYFDVDTAKNLESWDSLAITRDQEALAVYHRYADDWQIPRIQSPKGWLWDFWYVDKIPIISAFSPEIIGGKPDDWPNYVKCVGYFDLLSASNLKLDPALEEWLNKEPHSKPLLLSFGSILILEPRYIISLAQLIATEIGIRVIISADFHKPYGLETKPINDERIFQIKGAPFRNLLPRCQAIVHHGGAGTTGASLGAGVPQVIISFIDDQHFWGECVWRIGVGPEPLSYRTLKDEDLINAIKCALQDIIINKAIEVKAMVNNENAAVESIKIVDAVLKKNLNPHRKEEIERIQRKFVINEADSVEESSYNNQ